MENFVLWLIDVSGFLFSTLSERFPSEVGSQYFDLAFAWSLCIIAFVLIFTFAMIPKLLSFVYSMFGRWGKN